MTKINNWLNKNVLKIITIFILLQPILDLITSFQLNIFKNSITIGIIVRMFFMFFCIYYILILSRNKFHKLNIIYFLSLIIYFLIYTLLIISNKTYDSLLYEVTGLLKTFYFPILLLSFINITYDKQKFIKTKFLFITCFEYLILLLIPILLGTGFYAYKENIGYIGWFNSANEISAIISILLPFIFMYVLKINNNIYKIIPLIVLLFILFCVSTKTLILSFILIVIFLSIIYIINLIKQKNYRKIIIILIAFILFLVVIIIILPKTELYKSIETRLTFFDIKPTEIFTDIDSLDKVVFSGRLNFLKTTRNNFYNSSTLEKMFGIGYIENYGTDNINLKLIEMDYFDIFYRHGIIGFLLYFIVSVTCLIKIVIFVFKNKFIFKNNIYYLLSLVLIILLSLFTGHVLVAPAVSLYAVVILSYLYFEVQVIR